MIKFSKRTHHRAWTCLLATPVIAISLLKTVTPVYSGAQVVRFEQPIGSAAIMVSVIGQFN